MGNETSQTRILKAVVRYDGTDFAGWQVQPRERTVQGEIERALSTIANHPVRIHGAGRTDAGVHALGQVFSCPWPAGDTPERLRRALSRMLGPEIRVETVEEAAPTFHAQKSARGKRYAYTLALCREPDPLSARYAWCLPWPVDMHRLSELAQRLTGKHDFAGLQGGNASVKTTIRTVYDITVQPGAIIAPCDGRDLWRIDCHGNGFLYKMVRNMVSTLVDIARGHLPETRIDELLASPGPFQGHTAPAHGLALVQVIY